MERAEELDGANPGLLADLAGSVRVPTSLELAQFGNFLRCEEVLPRALCGGGAHARLFGPFSDRVNERVESIDESSQEGLVVGASRDEYWLPGLCWQFFRLQGVRMVPH